jgi:ADP-ribose pyrophosphatase YjhB (NUDIX family)
MYVDDAMLAGVRARYGEPERLEIELEISEDERDLVLASSRSERFHDVTLYAFSGPRLALIRKPHYAAGLWRPPGGGLKPGEPFEDGVRREALEELGVDVRLERYLLHVSAVFRCGNVLIPWATHVLSGAAGSEELAPLDRREIAAARWGTLAELQGPIRKRLLATGRALWRYRVALHDATAEALEDDGRLG